MSFAKFFIDRPIFATVLSILTMIVGGIAFFTCALRPMFCSIRDSDAGGT